MISPERRRGRTPRVISTRQRHTIGAPNIFREECEEWRGRRAQHQARQLMRGGWHICMKRSRCPRECLFILSIHTFLSGSIQEVVLLYRSHRIKFSKPKMEIQCQARHASCLLTSKSSGYKGSKVHALAARACKKKRIQRGYRCMVSAARAPLCWQWRVFSRILCYTSLSRLT